MLASKVNFIYKINRHLNVFCCCFCLQLIAKEKRSWSWRSITINQNCWFVVFCSSSAAASSSRFSLNSLADNLCYCLCMYPASRLLRLAFVPCLLVLWMLQMSVRCVCSLSSSRLVDASWSPSSLPTPFKSCVCFALCNF